MKIFRLLPIILLLLLVTSCSKNTDEKMRGMIPDDSYAVMSVNTKLLLEHFELQNGELPETIAKLLRRAGVRDEVQDVLDGLKLSGIDFENKSYFFLPGKGYVREYDNHFKFVGLIPLKSERDLIGYVESEWKGKKFKKESGKYILQYGALSLIVDDDVLMIGISSVELTAKKAIDESNLYFNLDKDKSILNNKTALEVLNNNDDIVAYLNVERLPEIFEDLSPEVPFDMSPLAFVDGADAMGYFANFADNEITLRCKVYGIPNDYRELISTVYSEPSSDALAQMPVADFMAVGSLSLNGQGILGLQYVKTIIPMLENAKDYRDFISEFNVNPVEIIKLLNGPVTLGVATNNFIDFNFTVSAKSPQPDQLKARVDSINFKATGLPSDKMIVESQGGLVNLKFSLGTDSVMVSRGVRDQEALSMFSKSPSAALVRWNVKGMTAYAYLDVDLKNLESKLRFYVTDGDQKLKLVDYPNFFKKLEGYVKELEALQRLRYRSSYNELDSVGYDDYMY